MFKKCPTCKDKIAISKIKKEFYCNSCKARLGSNRNTALMLVLIVWALLSPVFSIGLLSDLEVNSGFVEFLLDVIIGFILFVVLYPVFLNVFKNN